jgi:hypothetical protein
MARLLLTALVASMLAVGAAGCGGSDSDSADSAATTEAAADVTTSSSTDAETGTETETTSAADASTLDGDCADLADAASAYSEAFAASAAAAAGGDAGDIEQSAAALEAFADQAPEEIRDAYRTLAEAVVAYAAVVGDLDIEAGATPDAATIAKLIEASKTLGTTDIQAASSEITAWVTANC